MEQVIIELARFLNIAPEEAARRVKEYNVGMAAAKWREANPKTKDDVEKFYREQGAENYLYELIPWNYASPAYQERVAPLVQYHGRKILEIGAGIGSLCIALAYAGNQVTYCDISPVLGAFAMQRFEDRHLPIPVVTSVAGQRDFDIIVANDFFEHVHKDALPGLLRELAACLKDGGFVYHRSNFGQQDIFPMHFDHGEYFNQMATDAGIPGRKNGDLVKGKRTEGVQIGIPIVGDMGDEIFYSFVGLRKPAGSLLTKIGGKSVDIARNMIVDKLEKDWLFLMDSDQTFQPDTLERLLSWDLPIVSGLYFKSPGKPVPHAYSYAWQEGGHLYSALIGQVGKYLQQHKEALAKAGPAVTLPCKREELIEADGVGGGCLLIHRRVFNALEKPYFECNAGTFFGEDFYFCRKVRAAGFKIYVDPGVICGHKAKDLISHQHFLNFATTADKPTEFPFPWGA